MLKQLILTASLCISASVAALAQDQSVISEGSAFSQCGCIAPAGGGGEFTETSGQVFVSAPEGFVPVTAGVQFLSPAEVISGTRSSASVLLTGGCSVELGDLQTLVLSQPAGSTEPICARVIEAPSELATLAQTPVTPTTFNPAALIFGGNVIATIAAVLLVSL